MTNKIITSLKNPLVKQLRKLHRSRHRRQQNLLLLEGNNTIITALTLDYPLTLLCCTIEWQNRHQQLWGTISDRVPRVELVSPEVLSVIATTVNPDGVVAVANRQISQSSDCVINHLGLLAERLQDPGNLGTIIRTAVATGVEQLWLSRDSVDFDHPKVLRASAGEWFRLRMNVSDNLVQTIQEQKNNQVQVIATVPDATKTYWELDLTRPSLILLGNESAGLSPELIALADEKVTIPLDNKVESLNVAIATALILYESKRQNTFNI